MKKLLLLILLSTATTYSQRDPFNPDRDDRIGITQGFDLFNLLRGGKKLNDGTQRNGVAVDYRGRAFINFERNVEFGIYVEVFPAIDYYSHGLDLSYNIDIGKFSILPGVELQNVSRGDFDFGSWPYLNWGVNTRVRYFLSDKWFLEGQFNAQYRTDIIEQWGRKALPSGTIPALWESRSFYMSIGFIIN